MSQYSNAESLETFDIQEDNQLNLKGMARRIGFFAQIASFNNTTGHFLLYFKLRFFVEENQQDSSIHT